MRMRFSTSSNIAFGREPISWRKDSLATAIPWPRSRSLSRETPALALLEAKPKNSRIFNQPGRRRDDYGRWILGLIDEIGLEHQGRSKLSEFGFDARIEIDDI